MIFTLCSCKVNWFTETIEVPWYYVVVPIVLIVVPITVLVYATIIKATYICPECKTEFKPKWNHFFVCFHMMGERVAKCPKCGRKGFCEKKK